jgi:hypothetical protein
MMTINDNFFLDPASVDDSRAFNEGPPVIINVTTFTESIDTSAVDAFRQGVEITNAKFYDAGVIKIHAGDPGHVLVKTTHGENAAYEHNATFNDHFDVEPKTYVAMQKQTTNHQAKSPALSVPNQTLPVGFLSNYLSDGIIDPLAARSKKKQLSLDVDDDPNGVRGMLQSGNEALLTGSDVVETQYVISYGTTILETLQNTYKSARYKTLYSVDFSSLPSQQLTASGAYSINGGTWWAKGNDSMSSQIINGRGLVLSTTLQLEPWGQAAGSSYVYRFFHIAFSQFSNYNASKPVLVFYRVSGSGDFGYSRACTGFANAEPSATNWHSTDIEKGSCRGSELQVYSSPALGVQTRLIGRASTRVSGALSITAPNTVVCDYQDESCYTGAYSGSLPNDIAEIPNMNKWYISASPNDYFPYLSSSYYMNPPLRSVTGKALDATKGGWFICPGNITAPSLVEFIELKIVQVYGEDELTYGYHIASSSITSTPSGFNDLHRNAFSFAGAPMRDSDMNLSIQDLQPDQDSYVKPFKRSMPTGYTYDNCLQGADSLAFGGLTFPRQ